MHVSMRVPNDQPATLGEDDLVEKVAKKNRVCVAPMRHRASGIVTAALK